MIFSILSGLFAAAFLAATLLPGSSEVVLAGILALEQAPVALAVGVATIGNTLGSCVNWALGLYAIKFKDKRWFPASHDQVERYSKWYAKWGLWTLFLSWVPIIGDPLTVVAGMARTSIFIFFPIVLLAKLLRYLVVAGLIGFWV